MFAIEQNDSLAHRLRKVQCLAILAAEVRTIGDRRQRGAAVGAVHAGFSENGSTLAHRAHFSNRAASGRSFLASASMRLWHSALAVAKSFAFGFPDFR